MAALDGRIAGGGGGFASVYISSRDVELRAEEVEECLEA